MDSGVKPSLSNAAAKASIPTTAAGAAGNVLQFLTNGRVIVFIFLLIGFGLMAYFLKDRFTKLSKPPQASLQDLRVEQQKQVEDLQARYVNTQGQRADVKKTGLYPAIVSKFGDRQNYLINLCPLTVRLPGYLGPLREGIFDEKEGVRIAVAAGARGFFIPLSYYVDGTKLPPLYPESQTPAIVARADTGEFISKNGAFLATVLKEIINAKGRVNEPFLIFLHADNTIPNSRTQEATYNAYCSAVAEACKQLQPHLPKQVGQLGYTQKGRGNQTLMLQAPLQLLSQNIIVCSNLDISMEDDPKYKGTKLSDFVNILYSTDDKVTEGAKLVSLDSVTAAGDTFRKSARIQFTIGLPANEEVPTATQVQQAFAEGIQCIPLDLLASAEQLKEVWTLWQGAGWIGKPEALRYTKPQEIVPQKPSAALNAKVDGAQFAGQLMVR